MKMRDELPRFALSLNEMTVVHSKMAPIQVMHSICVIALKNPVVTLLGDSSVHVSESSINNKY